MGNGLVGSSELGRIYRRSGHPSSCGLGEPIELSGGGCDGPVCEPSVPQLQRFIGLRQRKQLLIEHLERWLSPIPLGVLGEGEEHQRFWSC